MRFFQEVYLAKRISQQVVFSIIIMFRFYYYHYLSKGCIRGLVFNVVNELFMLKLPPMKAEEWNQITCQDCKTVYSALLGIEQIRKRWIVDGSIRLSNFNVVKGGHLAVDNETLNTAGDVVKRKSVGLLCQVLKHMR